MVADAPKIGHGPRTLHPFPSVILSRTYMPDPLSQVLTILRPGRAIGSGLELSGEWSFRFPSHDGIKFSALMRGTCWLRLQGHQAWQRLDAGDCFLMTHGVPFDLASNPNLPPQDGAELYDLSSWPLVPENGEESTLIVGGRFVLAEGDAVPLLSALPSFYVVRHASPYAAVLNFALQQFATELESDQPGASLLTDHLAHVMFVHLLRIYLADAPPEATSWLRALGDKRLSRSLAAMHGQPAHAWSLQDLANAAGMSRTSFAAAFKQAVGYSPMEYLTMWRMLLAKEQLRQGKTTAASIAAQIGYRSEAAFSTAFKRTLGISPRQARTN
ncbi:MAG: AraC family transcriptional regulator [Hyphomicrobiales bacterium]|nr:MAG: AraC family transcriptional regulator [Hyphomicrobiales bacterium]